MPTSSTTTVTCESQTSKCKLCSKRALWGYPKDVPIRCAIHSTPSMILFK